MPLLAKRGRPDGRIPMSSMADIAFLLLVFFLVTTVFPKDRGLPLHMPEGISEVSPTNVLHLLISAGGSVEIRYGRSPQSRIVAPDEVEEIWRQAVDAKPGMIAAVKTAPEAAYGSMIAVLDALQRAGAKRISLELWEG